MYKRTVLLFVLVYSFALVWHSVGDSGTKKTQHLSSDYTMLDKSRYEDLHEAKKNALEWPSEAKAAENMVDTEDAKYQNAVQTTMEWLKSHLCEDYIPNELDDFTFLPLKHHYVGKHDVLRLRYQKGQHIVQILATSHVVTIVTRNEEGSSSEKQVDPEQAKEFIIKAANEILIDFNLVKELPIINIRKTMKGVQGQFGSAGVLSQWNDTFWWTDGNTVLFQVSKYAGQGYWPEPPKDWF